MQGSDCTNSTTMQIGALCPASFEFQEWLSGQGGGGPFCNPYWTRTAGRRPRRGQARPGEPEREAVLMLPRVSRRDQLFPRGECVACGCYDLCRGPDFGSIRVGLRLWGLRSQLYRSWCGISCDFCLQLWRKMEHRGLLSTSVLFGSSWIALFGYTEY